MTRLTRRTHNGITVNGCKTVYGQFERGGARLTSAIVRLAALEDILYAPDGTELITLDRLRELVRADKDGRIRFVAPPTPYTKALDWAIRRCTSDCWGAECWSCSKARAEAEAALGGKGKQDEQN